MSLHKKLSKKVTENVIPIQYKTATKISFGKRAENGYTIQYREGRFHRKQKFMQELFKKVTENVGYFQYSTRRHSSTKSFSRNLQEKQQKPLYEFNIA